MAPIPPTQNEFKAEFARFSRRGKTCPGHSFFLSPMPSHLGTILMIIQWTFLIKVIKNLGTKFSRFPWDTAKARLPPSFSHPAKDRLLQIS